MEEKIEVYHGTIYSHGLEICENQEFFLSKKDNEWLGDGIYFWDDESVATWWADLEAKKEEHIGQPPVVLSVTLSFDKRYFLNLDEKEQMDAFIKESEKLQKALQSDKDFSTHFRSTHQQKAFFCNYYKKQHNIVLIAYTFPVYDPRTHKARVFSNSVGFEYTEVRKQYCATDNRIIDKIILKEVDDYAI